MDLALISTLLLIISSGITRVLISYDIACQWIKYLAQHLSLYSVSSSFNLSLFTYLVVVIPKFHLAGHARLCQLLFNINYTKGAARMTGEMIESGWAQSGSLAIWTRESGPFARRAVLDDHWGSENWLKLRRLRKWIVHFNRCGLCLPPLLGITLLKNLEKALIWSKTQRAIANNASDRLPTETLADWDKMRRDFDRDKKQPNPYAEPEPCKSPRLFRTFPMLILTVMTMESLRHQLDQDEARESREGRTPPHAVTASAFIGDALRIEQQQYALHYLTHSNQLSLPSDGMCG